MLVPKIDRFAPSRDRLVVSTQRELVQAHDVDEAARIIRRLYPHFIVTHDGRTAAR